MSAPTNARGGSSRLMKAVAAVAAVGALAFGANAIAHSGGASSAAAQTSQAGPGGGSPGILGRQVSGATLTKLEAVVLAQYPGTVERAMKLTDGSYVVHVIRSGGTEVHVTVSRDFKISGTEQGPPGGSRGGTPPSGSQS